MDILSSKVLVLNRSYLAIGVCTVKDALKLSVEGVANILDKDWVIYDFDSWANLRVDEGMDSVGLVKKRIRAPRVIRLSEFNKIPRKVVKFNRINVLLRDSFTCQYCNEQKDVRELNLDHVVPRAQGGETSWENIVTSCYDCNSQKADRTPDEAGVELNRIPFKPSWTHIQVLAKKSLIHEEWVPFLKHFGVEEETRA